MSKNARKKISSRTQYTIRNVPRSVDQALRKKAQRLRQSLNAVLLDALLKDAGVGAEPKVYDDLDYLVGSWVSDPETEHALTEQRRIETGDWD